jgi:hypothetical protein
MSVLAAVRGLAWERPTKQVPVPEALKTAAPSLPDGFTVMMASADDIAFVGEVDNRAKNLAAMIDTLAANDVADKAAALKAAVGLDGQPCGTFNRQVEFILRCVSDPVLDREDVLWVNRYFPGFFTALFAAVIELSGEGARLGKLPSSGETPSSEPQ